MTTTETETKTTPALAENHVQPILGDMLCIRTGNAGEWAFSGDRFHAAEGDTITASQHFAGGQVRFTHHDKSAFRVLRGTRLFHIA